MLTDASLVKLVARLLSSCATFAQFALRCVERAADHVSPMTLFERPDVLTTMQVLFVLFFCSRASFSLAFVVVFFFLVLSLISIDYFFVHK